MDLFDPTIKEIKDWFDRKTDSGELRRYQTAPEVLRQGFSGRSKAGKAAGQSIILKEDASLELGHPSVGSCSGVLVTREASLARNGLITHVGPDISETAAGMLPFAQIIVACCQGDGLEQISYKIDRTASFSVQSEGYMIKSVPRLIWSRVSREAAGSGFSIRHIGERLIGSLLAELDGVTAVEVFFATTSRSDVAELDSLLDTAREKQRKIDSFAVSENGVYECTEEQDCELCPEQTVCDSIRDVIKLRKGDRLISFGEDGAEVTTEE